MCHVSNISQLDQMCHAPKIPKPFKERKKRVVNACNAKRKIMICLPRIQLIGNKEPHVELIDNRHRRRCWNVCWGAAY